MINAESIIEPSEPLLELTKVFSDVEFFEDLNRRIGSAQPDERIRLYSMSYNPGEPRVEEVCDNLALAAERGCDVALVTDAYTFMRPGSFFGSRLQTSKGRRQADVRRLGLKRVDEAGVQTDIINARPRVYGNSYVGASHMKIHIVGDYVYIGGCNYDGTGRPDIFVGFEDPEASDYLVNLIDEIRKEKSTDKVFGGQDIELDLTNGDKLLIDSGAKGKSIIQGAGEDLVDSAEDWVTFSSQYLPVWSMAKALSKAQRRGLEVEIVSGGGRVNRAAQTFLNLAAGKKNPAPKSNMLVPKPIHYSAIATEKGTIIGGHNFQPLLVIAGTNEIAYQTADPRLAEQARQIMKSSVQVA